MWCKLQNHSVNKMIKKIGHSPTDCSEFHSLQVDERNSIDYDNLVWIAYSER